MNSAAARPSPTHEPDNAAKSAAARRDQTRRIFENNLKALRLCDAPLAERLRTFEGPIPELEPAADQQWTARVALDDGRTSYIHSQRDPRGEAERFIAARLQERAAAHKAPVPPASAAIGPECADAAPTPAPEDAVYVMLGLGLGHHLAALDRLAGRPLIVVFEPSLAMLVAAFHANDFTIPLLSRRLLILTSPDRAGAQESLRRFHTYLMLGTHLLSLPIANRFRAAEHAQMASSIAEVVRILRVQYMTLLKINRVTFGNLLENLPLYVSQPGIGPLAGVARGYPAVVIGAGPSLAHHFDALRALQNRAVLIAVQTVFRTLREQGITPHFVTSLDYHEISRQFFTGVDPAGTILVAEAKVAASVPREFRGRKLLLHTRAADDLLQSAAPPRAALRPGTTVAHLAFYLAEHLGCADILLCGVDLAFSDGLYYAPGMPIERGWTPELGRFRTLEMTQWERIVRIRPILQRVPTWSGGELFTDEPMYTYIRAFEQDFAQSRARVHVAGGSGARIAGAAAIEMADFVATHAQRKLPGGLFHADESADRDATHGQRERALQALRARLDEVGRVREIAAKSLEETRAMPALLARPQEFNRAVKRIHALRDQLAPFEKTYSLIVLVSQAAELRRIDDDRRMRGEEAEESPAAARRRVDRDQRFASDFLGGCDYLLRVLPEAIERLRAEQP